jgi:hypothetical protein
MVKIIIEEEDEEEHDPKTCFRCRLHDLWEETKATNRPTFMLIAMAEACGSILSQMESEDVKMFITAVVHFLQEDQDETKPYRKTKH